MLSQPLPFAPPPYSPSEQRHWVRVRCTTREGVCFECASPAATREGKQGGVHVPHAAVSLGYISGCGHHPLDRAVAQEYRSQPAVQMVCQGH